MKNKSGKLEASENQEINSGVVNFTKHEVGKSNPVCFPLNTTWEKISYVLFYSP